MKNKIAGSIIIGIAAIIGFITWSFNRALTNIVNTSCTHGVTCPMWGNIKFQTNLSVILMVLVALIGLYLIFFGQEKIEIIKKIREKVRARNKNYDSVLKTLTSEEKKLFNLVLAAQGAIFQSELVDNSGFDKVKVSRILDRLEGQNLIERRRRGMTNIVVLRQN